MSKISPQKVISDPHPSLHQQSQTIKKIDQNVKDLIATMQATIASWEDDQSHYISVGLAAVQIDQPYRVILVRGDDDKFYTLINPEIVKYDGLPIVDYESCMSVHGLHGKVPRYPKIRVRALNEDGEAITFTAKGYEAKIIQHEVDHTNGLIFLDRSLREDQGGRFKILNEATGEFEYVKEPEYLKNKPKD
jgi:peptide deformylase